MDLANGANSKNLKINMSDTGATVREMILQMNTPSGDRWVGEPFWALNKWVHLAITVDQDATIRLYRSGVLIATEGSGFAEEIARSKHWFGKSTHPGNYFQGMLDEIRIYDRPIIAQEAMQLASAVNTTPYDLNATTVLSIDENQPSGTMVGDINATDADAWDALTFSLVPGALDNDLFSIDPNGTLTSATTFDYETMDANLSVRYA